MSTHLLKTTLSVLALALLSGCNERQGPPAPYEQYGDQKTNYGFVVVQRGDSVSKLALKHNASIQEIIKINALKPPYALYIGQKLMIPGLQSGLRAAPFEVTVAKLDPKAAPTIKVEKLTDTPPSPSEPPLPDVAPGAVPEVHKRDLLPQPDIEPGALPAVTNKGKEVRKVVSGPVPEADLIDEIEDPVIPVPDIPLKKEESKLPIKKDKKPFKDQEDTAGPKERPVALKNKSAAQKPEDTKEEPKKDATLKSPLSFKWPTHGDIIRTFKKGKNDGINIAAPEGSPVVAAEEGTVAYVGDKLPGFGNLIMIKHRNGWMTAYAHTKDVVVKREMKVKKGQEIAKVGQTGNVNAPQLHFEVRKRTQAVDPKPLLE